MSNIANKPLLILSIFAPSEHNSLWYDLQRRFIRKTTTVDYDYGLFLNGIPPVEFESAHVLNHSETNEGHKAALARLLSYARQHPYYDNYLFLDSDCFPVGENWYAELTGQMKRFNKTIAAPVRVENLDLFPHPCAVLIAREEIHNERIDFRDDISIKNMLGIEVSDVGSAMYGMDEVMPLLRTNVVNVDPVAAAIYHHMFYHHGAGSRAFNFRITNRYRYYDHWWRSDDKEQVAKYLLRNLERNPDKFFNMLMGNRANLIQRMWGRFLYPYCFF